MKAKLLVVDDSNVSRLMIRERVAVLKHDSEVIESSGGDKVVALVPTAKPDFITIA